MTHYIMSNSCYIATGLECQIGRIKQNLNEIFRDPSDTLSIRSKDHLEMALFLLFPMETRCQDRFHAKTSSCIRFIQVFITISHSKDFRSNKNHYIVFKSLFF